MSIISGYYIAEYILKQVKINSKFLKIKHKIKIKIVTVQIGINNASNIYIKQKLRVSKQIDINTKLIHLNKNVNKLYIKKLFINLNKDKTINGIIVQLPIPINLNISHIINMIEKDKDIDCFNHYNSGLLFHQKDHFLPCTTQAILAFLKKYIYKDIIGKKVTIIGRSIIVGKPTSITLLNKSCTITVIHSKTLSAINECSSSDILIVSSGSPRLIKKNWIKKNCFIIDVGINNENNRLIGDVDCFNILDKASHITSVPGGIGPVTVANLMSNSIYLTCKQNNIYI